MRKWIATLSVFTAMLSSEMLSGEIIETPRFADLLSYVTPGCLVVLDIDDTLLIPQQSLGNDCWFTHRMRRYEEAGSGKSEALEKALADWQGVRMLTKVRIVEEGTAEIINSLQEQGVSVMALTTQGLALATRTILQLDSLGIQLAQTAPTMEDIYFINGTFKHQQGVLFREGVLFTSGTKKGTALLTLLSKTELTPTRVIFINDKLTHLRDVEESLEEVGLDFIGLRYSHEDERVKNFDPELAELQWHHSTLGRLLSDEEARELLQTTTLD